MNLTKKLILSQEFEDLRPSRSSITENETLIGNGELTLMSTTGKGCIKSIFLVIGGSTTYTSRMSRIQIIIDGFLTVDAPVFDFFFSRGFGSDDGNGTHWHSDRVGMSKHYDTGEGDIRCGWYKYIDIPYKYSCNVKLINGDNANDGSVWAAISYKEGKNVASDVSQFPYYWEYLGSQPGELTGRVTTPYEEVTLLEEDGRGLLESIWLTVYQNPGEPWVEGNFEIYIDGEVNPSVRSSGTEDFFMSAFAWVEPYHTRNHGCVVREANGFTNCYRFLLPEFITFKKGIKVIWNAGQEEQGEIEEDMEIWSGVGYYLK